MRVTFLIILFSCAVGTIIFSGCSETESDIIEGPGYTSYNRYAVIIYNPSRTSIGLHDGTTMVSSTGQYCHLFGDCFVPGSGSVQVVVGSKHKLNSGLILSIPILNGSSTYRGIYAEVK